MIFFIANDGTVIKSVPSPVYQGSANSNDVIIVAPFAANLNVSVAFKLPNGVYTGRFPMTKLNELDGVINGRTGKPYSCWQFSMPNDITRYYGTVTAQFFFYSAHNGAITASSSVSFVVGQGVPPILPDTPSEDVYDLILANISALQSQLNNGTFAARAIYAWNSVYKYGAGELAFYPDRGEYGAFIKSLVADNVNLPYVDGELNSEYWKEIADFNILNELYGLKGDVLEAVEQTAAAAASAKQSANTAADLADAAATSAQTALAAAESVQDTKVKIDEILDGTTPVPKAISDGTGANIAEHFGDIEKLIPSTTTAENQLADKAFVNSSINNMAAFYITSTASGDAFSTRDDLLNATEYYYGGEPRTPTQNDYAIVLADESQPKGAGGNYPTTRYSYQGGKWAFQYVVNNTSLTQAQVDAINSGITKELVAQIGTEENSSKNLYNLGVYDTFVSNGDGTVTITRKTGYAYFDGSVSERWEHQSTTPGNYRMKLDNAIFGITKEQNNSNVKFVANKNEITASQSWGASNTGVGIENASDEGKTFNVVYFSSQFNKSNANTLNEFKIFLAENPIYIQYELESPYTETVIENQPIHTLPQDGEVWLRDEWEKGLNLASVSYTNLSFIKGENRMQVINAIPVDVGTNYCIQFSGRKSSSESWDLNGFGGWIALFWDSPYFSGSYSEAFFNTPYKYENEQVNIKLSVTAEKPYLLIIMGNEGSHQLNINIRNLMLNKGSFPYPYKPYYGELTRNGVKRTGDTMTGSLNFPISEDTNVMVRTAIVSGQEQGDNTHGETERQNAKAHGIELVTPGNDVMKFNEWSGVFEFYRTGSVYHVPDGGDGELVGRISANGIAGTKFVQLDHNKEYVDLVTGIGENFGVNGKGGQIYNLAHMLRKNDFYTSIKSSVSVSSNPSANVNRVASVTATNNSPCLLTVFGVETVQHGVLMISSTTSINSSWSNDNNNGSNILAKTEGEQGYWSRQYLCCSVLIPPNQTAYVYARYLEKIRYTLQPVFSL